MNRFFATTLAGLTACTLSAQSLDEALLYSRMDLLGSPRFTSMGGAYSALGNDFSAITLNPASVAIFRQDEVQGTLGVSLSRASSDFFGTGAEEIKTDFELLTAGGVFGFKLGGNRWNVGLSYNQTASFDRDLRIRGQNPESSIIDQWIANSNGYSPDDLFNTGRIQELMAWEAYLTDIADSSDWSYTSFATGLDLDQDLRVLTYGQAHDFNVSAGTQVGKQWSFGFALGFPGFDYNEERTYRESGFDSGSTVDRFRMSEIYTSSGSGFNIKLGAIYRPIQSLRIGLGFTSPTWYQVTAVYTGRIHTDFRDGTSADSYEYVNDQIRYGFTSPMRLNAGVAYVIGKNGLVTVDYQLQDMGQNRLRSRKYSLDTENELIKDVLQPVHTVSAGGELRLSRIYLRGGYRYQTSPFVESAAADPTQAFSTGIGYRNNTWSVDLGWTRQIYGESYYPYSRAFTSPADVSTTRSMVTVGVAYRP